MPTVSAHVAQTLAQHIDHVFGVMGNGNAYFLDARNIGDVEVLADVAVRHGFDRQEARAIALDPAACAQVEEEVARSAAAGIRSVPHVDFGSGVAISGGRSEAEMASAIREAMRRC